jgi:Uma2 family endonuclease
MSAVLEKKMTWKEFREMDFPEDDRFFYELINGILMQKQAPAPLHQEILL